MELRRYEQSDAIFTEDLSNLQYVRDKYTVNGNPTIVNSPYGKAMNFDGSDDYLDFGNNGNVASIGSTNFTFSAWIKTSNTTDSIKIIRKEGVDPRIYMRVTGGALHVLVDDGSTLVQVGGAGVTDVDDGQWHHVVATFNLSDKILLYVDGVNLVESGSIAGLGTLVNNNNLQISDAADTFDGVIKNVIIFKRLLTATEISDIYNNKAFDYERAIISEWDLSSI